MKYHLRGKRFAIDTDVKQAVNCLQAFHTHLFLSVIQAFSAAVDRYLNVSSNYVEH